MAAGSDRCAGSRQRLGYFYWRPGPWTGYFQDRLVKAAEIIIVNNLVRYEIGIRQWAKNDKRAAKAVRLANRRRLDFGRRAFGEMGFSDDEAEVRALLFVCYYTWEGPMFPEIPQKRRRQMIAKRIALLTRK